MKIRQYAYRAYSVEAAGDSYFPGLVLVYPDSNNVKLTCDLGPLEMVYVTPREIGYYKPLTGYHTIPAEDIPGHRVLKFEQLVSGAARELK